MQSSLTSTVVVLAAATSLLATPVPGVRATSASLSAGCKESLAKGKDLLDQRKLPEAQDVLLAATKACPDAADIFNALGLALDFNNQFPEAQKAYGKAVALDPRNVAFRNNLAASYLRSGQKSSGTAEFRKVLAVDPNNSTANLNLGSLALTEEQYLRATQYFRAAGVERSHDLVSLLQLTDAYFGAGNAQAARATAMLISQQAGSDARVRFSLGLELAEHGQYRMAAEQFEAITPSERDPATNLNLGMVYSRLHQPEKARHAYEEAIRLDPASPDPYLRMGLDASFERNHGAAVDWINQAYAKAPGRVDILYALVEELIRAKNYERARSLLSASLARKPNEPSLLEALGDLYSSQRQEQEASGAYQTCLRASPSRTSARLSLARVHLALRQNDEAKNELEKVLQADPQNPAANAELARIALEANQLDLGLKLVRQALAGDPNSLSANEYLARIQLRQGNAAEALPTVERLLKLEPQNPQYHYLLGQVFVKLQRRQDAQKEFQLSKQLEAERNQAPAFSPPGEERP